MTLLPCLLCCAALCAVLCRDVCVFGGNKEVRTGKSHEAHTAGSAGQPGAPFATGTIVEQSYAVIYCTRIRQNELVAVLLPHPSCHWEGSAKTTHGPERQQELEHPADMALGGKSESGKRDETAGAPEQHSCFCACLNWDRRACAVMVTHCWSFELSRSLCEKTPRREGLDAVSINSVLESLCLLSRPLGAATPNAFQPIVSSSLARC